jgi:hypothetical protein
MLWYLLLAEHWFFLLVVLVLLRFEGVVLKVCDVCLQHCLIVTWGLLVGKKVVRPAMEPRMCWMLFDLFRWLLSLLRHLPLVCQWTDDLLVLRMCLGDPTN